MYKQDGGNQPNLFTVLAAWLYFDKLSMLPECATLRYKSGVSPSFVAYVLKGRSVTTGHFFFCPSCPTWGRSGNIEELKGQNTPVFRQVRLPPNNNYQIQLTHSVLKMRVDSSLSKSQGIILTTTVLYGIILTKKWQGYWLG